MSTDQQKPSPEAGKTPMFIGAGVQITGTIRHTGAQDERAVIVGEFTGDIEWNGVLHVPPGGKLVVEKALRCREILVSGDIVGASESALIETGLLRLGQTASVEIGEVSVPPGGLEQQRGSVVNAKLRMTKENAYASQGDSAAGSASAPNLTLVSASSQAPAASTGLSDEDSNGDVPRFLTAQGGV